ncbi:hypothetical protein [Gordonia terrae]
MGRKARSVVEGAHMVDIGLRLLESLYRQLMIDDQWALRRERGFTWWSYRLAQHVEVSPPFMSQGIEASQVRIWTETVGAVDPNSDPARVVASLNIQATLDALVWQSDRAMISRCSTAVVHDHNFGWISEVLATAATLQNDAAHYQAHDLARALGGEPAASNHPFSGVRNERDDILNVPSQVVVREGSHESRFTGSSMANVARFLVEKNFLGSADDTGLTCEVPFSRNEPVAVTSLAGGDQLHSSLVQVYTDVAHPETGSGMLVTLKLPVSPHPAEVATIANGLNVAEARGESSANLLGAWCSDPTSERTVAYCSFVPNLLSRHVRAESVVLDLAARSRFACGFLGG